MSAQSSELDGDGFQDPGPLFGLSGSYIVTITSSVMLHAAILFLLASVVVPVQIEEEIFLELSNSLQEEPVVPDPSVNVIVQPNKLVEAEMEDAISSVEVLENSAVPSPTLADLTPDDIAAAITLPNAESIVSSLPGHFGGRSERGKLASLRIYGGTADSERAVHSGLRWLASIQQEDGSWDFTRIGDARNPGSLVNGETGATSMALLCFLGAGHTHGSATKYSDVVRRGLHYLVSSAKVIAGEADMRGDVSGNGGMYIQGIATIALCEAHAMSRKRDQDKNLKRVAQAAIRFIESSQAKGGGWRYRPRDAGDTSVVGWQVMALKSGQAGRLRVQPETFYSAQRFLNRVQTQSGGMYGYTGPQKNRTGTTAIGLLCRMYMGWRRDREGLADGVAFIAKRGPSRNDTYYNYYGSQVLHHWGGDLWKEWNAELRPRLVESQVKEGPSAGSWRPVCKHSGSGGRLYETALSIMTLEVYYRHLPLYRKSAVTSADPAIGE
ncbi:MAG: prenyltransferase/squalene oxidase repeat-containing protein [Planctomycetaceae bacterium]